MSNFPWPRAAQNISLPAILLLPVMLFFAGVAPAHAQSSSSPSPASTQTQDQAAPKADSPAEAARKARAKKATSTPAKVYTDENMSKGGGGVSVVGQSSASGGSSDDQDGGAGQQTAGKSGGPDEKYWRSKARELHAKIDALDQQINQLKEDIKKNGSSGFDASSGLKQNVIYINDKNGRVQQLEKQKEGVEKQLEQLAEEGRKAGAPAGWFR